MMEPEQMAINQMVDESAAADNAEQAGSGRRSGAHSRLAGTGDFLPRAAIPFLLVACFALFSILSPHLFFTWTNVRIMISAQATVLLLALAATIPLRAGDFDLSIGAVMILSGSAVGLLYGHGAPVIVCFVVPLGIGLFIGLMNCLFVVKFGLNSLIVTLGMLTLLSGITNYLTGDNLVTTIPHAVEALANTRLLTLPYIVWIGWLVAFLIWIVFEFTPLGRYLLFLGGNPTAAVLAGLRVSALRCGAFLACAIISALAGILLAGSLGSVDPSSAGSYLLPPFTAAFLGTTMIQLGRFNVGGTLVGLYLLAVGITGLQLLGVQGWVTDVFNGAALIVAIAFARLFEVRGIGRARRTSAKRVGP
jgi:ribose transport system permease protein